MKNRRKSTRASHICFACLALVVALAGCDGGSANRSESTSRQPAQTQVALPAVAESAAGAAPLVPDAASVATAAGASAATTAGPDRGGMESVIQRQEIRAQLMPGRYTTLAAEVGAKIDQIAVSEGMSFAAGQLLVVFDCNLQQAQLQKTRAELMAAEKTFSANTALEKLNGVGKLELDLSEAAVQRAQAEINNSQTLLSKCNINAPYAGRVAEQRVRAQQFVQAGQPLLDIIDNGPLELEFIIPSQWLSWVKPGVGFNVVIDETRQSYPARFTRIGARVDAVSQSIKVAAAIDGRFPGLIAGMSGRVEIVPPPIR